MNLDHPHIIKLLDHLEDQNNVYLVLELANRGSLFSEIRRNKHLSEERIRTFFRQTCEGISYLHDHDIIHRDIKPENLLLDANGNIKICDFGWCVKSKETRTTFCGTMDYMAPEMILGEGHSFSIDVWALGVLLYELSHGQAPFPARKESEKCQQILTLSYHLDPNLSPSLSDLIKSMLKISPEARPKVSEILTHPWMRSEGQKSWEVRVGMRLKSYVKGYGIAEGEVVGVVNDQCQVFFPVPEVKETMQVSKAAKMIMKKAEKDGMDPKLLCDDEVPVQLSEEEKLLRCIDEWCTTPRSQNPKKSGFLLELEETSKKLEQSLALIQQGKEPFFPAPNAEIQRTKPPKHLIISEEQSRENTEVEYEDVGPWGKGVFLAESTPSPRPESANSEELKEEFLSLPQQKDADQTSVPLEEEMLNEEFKPEQVILVPQTPPALDQVPFKMLANNSLYLDELTTSRRSSWSIDSEKGKERTQGHDFDKDRDLIDSMSQQFYSQAEEKWAQRVSQESIIEAPELALQYETIDKRDPEIVREIAQLQAETRRDPMELSPQKLGKANEELEARKKRLSELLKSAEMMKSAPIYGRVKRPSKGKQESAGFLRWIGSVFGCTQRY